MNKPVREGFVADETAPVEKPEDVIDATVEPSLPLDRIPDVWPVKVKLLYKKIRDQRGNELSELSFRQPTGGDINRHGMPVRVDMSGDILIDERKMMFMMTALTGIMTPVLETMDPRDWVACAYRLRGFFIPDPAAW